MTRFVVCGETLIDLVRSDTAPNDTFSSTWHALSAGGPMNSAVALGKLGNETHFLGRLSNDAFGRQLRAHIEGAGVELDMATTTDESTSLAVVSLDAIGKATYAFHFTNTANFNWQASELPKLTAADWLHVASLALVVDPGAEVLLSWTEQTDALLSIDVNVRPTVISDPKEYWRRIEPWVRTVGARGGLVKASDEDIEFLAKAGPNRTWKEVAESWVADYGVGFVLVTRGEGGASALPYDGSWIDVAGFPTQVADTVGAGDTFMAGFLDGYVAHSSDLASAMTRGAAAAAIVCARKGAQPPTANEVDALIRLRAQDR
jgi:fructokinase